MRHEFFNYVQTPVSGLLFYSFVPKNIEIMIDWIKSKLNFTNKDCLCMAMPTDPNYHDHEFFTVEHKDEVLYIQRGWDSSILISQKIHELKDKTFDESKEIAYRIIYEEAVKKQIISQPDTDFMHFNGISAEEMYCQNDITMPGGLA